MKVGTKSLLIGVHQFLWAPTDRMDGMDKAISQNADV